MQVGRQFLDQHADARQVIGEPLHVTARAEGLARPRDDHATNRGILIDLQGGMEEIAPQREVQRVERVRPVQGDGGDSVCPLKDQVLVGHGILRSFDG